MKDLLKKQREFEKVIGVPIDTILEKERNQMSEMFLFKLIEEAIETRREFPSVMNAWAKNQKQADPQRISEELSDVFLFFINLLIVWRIDWPDFIEQVKKTQNENYTKIKEKKMRIFNEEILNVPGYTTGVGQGNINPKYVFVGQNPGKGITHGYKVWSDPESGSSKVLLPLLSDQHVIQDCYFTNFVKSTTIDNKEPTDELTAFWEPRLYEELAILFINNPDMTVISMGKWTQERMQANATIPHPSWALRDPANLDKFKFELLNAMRLQPVLNI